MRYPCLGWQSREGVPFGPFEILNQSTVTAGRFSAAVLGTSTYADLSGARGACFALGLALGSSFPFSVGVSHGDVLIRDDNDGCGVLCGVIRSAGQ